MTKESRPSAQTITVAALIVCALAFLALTIALSPGQGTPDCHAVTCPYPTPTPRVTR